MSEAIYPKQGDGAVILVPIVGVKVESDIPVEIAQGRWWMERLFILLDQKDNSATQRASPGRP